MNYVLLLWKKFILFFKFEKNYKSHRIYKTLNLYSTSAMAKGALRLWIYKNEGTVYNLDMKFVKPNGSCVYFRGYSSIDRLCGSNFNSINVRFEVSEEEVIYIESLFPRSVVFFSNVNNREG